MVTFPLPKGNGKAIIFDDLLIKKLRSNLEESYVNADLIKEASAFKHNVKHIWTIKHVPYSHSRFKTKNTFQAKTITISCIEYWCCQMHFV